MLPDSFEEILRVFNISTSDKLLIAVSGGVDSVVAARLAGELKLSFAIGHVNFNLRGDESDQDESFVRELSQTLNARFYSTHVDTKKYARDKQISTQMAARELRYTWFSELMHENGFDYIVTGHHLDDAFETALFNLTKGTGIAGLRSILPLQDQLLRPLLHATRAEILSYANEKRWSWREDSSNKEDSYRRNFIRHHIVPRLREINPSLAETFRATQRRLIDAEQVILREADKRRQSFIRKANGDTWIHRDAFHDQNIALAEVLLGEYGLTFSQVNDLLECISRGEISRMFLTQAYRLNLDRDYLIVSPAGAEPVEIRFAKENQSLEHPLGIFNILIEDGNEPVLQGSNEASLDFDQLSEDLIIRKWKDGDRFRPLGMEGKKKISDFMIDEKIPLNLKERIYVLESAGDIAWVIGYRIGHDFRITEDTQKRFNIILDHDQSV
jgi:tRNA(Ile)-lysidine synthase